MLRRQKHNTFKLLKTDINLNEAKNNSAQSQQQICSCITRHQPPKTVMFILELPAHVDAVRTWCRILSVSLILLIPPEFTCSVSVGPRWIKIF